MKTVINIICILVLFESSAQNLVPNWSFEDTISAPCSSWSFPALNNWTLPSNGSSDYYHENCSPYVNGVPSNENGYQFAKTGKAYVGILTYWESNSSSYREYIKVQLIETLETGMKYQWSFWVSKADNMDYVTNNIGIYLGPNINDLQTQFVLPVAPIGNRIYLVQDSINWIQVCGEYTANGTEDYLIIGNFFENDQTTILKIQQDDSFTTGAYYFIDDVYLSTTFISCEGNVGIEEIDKPTKKVIRIIDIMGRKSEDIPNTLLIYIYSDGSTEKIFRVE